MSIDDTLQATLLLCCYFNKNEVRDFKPLTPTEYGPFARWLHENKFNPADLLQRKNEILTLWHDPKGKVSSERIEGLLSRGVSMGFALEKWSKSGIWVISRADSAYPKELKNKLKELSPPVLFGAGNKDLLYSMGIGFVGSRSIDNSDKAFTEAKAQLAVKQGFTVVSGGAKGVDQTSMLSALKAGGCSVGVLADSLFRSSASKIYREYLAGHRLLLISPFYPEAGFNTGNAMARNKYIYSLSKAVVVVKSDLNKGGTWNGAKESLAKGLSVTLIRNANHPGNQELIKRGGNAIDDTFNDFTQDFKTCILSQQSDLTPKKTKTGVQNDLFSFPPNSSQNTEELQHKDAGCTKTSRNHANKNESTFSDNSIPDDTIEPPLANAPDNKPEVLYVKTNKNIVDSINTEQQKIANSQNQRDTNNKLSKRTLDCTDPVISTSITTTLPKAILTTTHSGRAANHLQLEEYGVLLKLFYQDILKHCQNKKQVSMEDLKKFYPELTSQGISKWLKILTDKKLLIRVNKRHLYRPL